MSKPLKASASANSAKIPPNRNSRDVLISMVGSPPMWNKSVNVLQQALYGANYK
jgi:hypothetical protein